jgi:hypothetical protein
MSITSRFLNSRRALVAVMRIRLKSVGHINDQAWIVSLHVILLRLGGWQIKLIDQSN